jgi:hypothetical protein
VKAIRLLILPSLPHPQKKKKEKKIRVALFVSRFSPDVNASDVEKSSKDQLQLASLTSTRLKTKHNSYVSFGGID